MSRSRAIETRLEKLTPALDEYFSSGFLNRREVMELSRKRTHWEYRLVAKPLLLLDVQNAIQFELELEERLQKYCAAAKLTLRNRWSILERVEGLYRIGLKNLRVPPQKEIIRKECVQFHKKFGRTAALGKLYAEWMVGEPRRSDLWAEAAEWSAIDQKNAENGRSIIQQALVTMGGEACVWASALKIELHVGLRLLRGVIETHRAEMKRQIREASDGRPAEDAQNSNAPIDYSVICAQLRKENESMGLILLDLALAKTVVEEALESAACSPDLIKRLLDVCLKFPTAADLARYVIQQGQERSLRYLDTGAKAAQKVKVQWSEHAADLLWASLSVEHCLVNQGPFVIATPTHFVESGAAVGRPSVEDSRKAAALSLISVVTLMNEVEDNEGVRASLQHIKNIGSVFAEGVRGVLEFLERTGAEPNVVSQIAFGLLSVDFQTKLTAEFLRRSFLPATHKGKVSDAYAQAIDLGRQLAMDLKSVPPPTRKVRYENSSNTDDMPLTAFWPPQVFSLFLNQQDALSLAPLLEGNAANAQLSAVEIDRLLVWLKAQDGEEESRKAERKRKIIQFFVRHQLFSQKSLKMYKEMNDNSSTQGGVDLLSRPFAVHHVAGKTPVTVWKIFNALEVLDQGGHSESDSARGSSDADSGSDEEGAAKCGRCGRASCYATAGLNFLASVNHGSLTHVDEWSVVEGISSLIRSRFFSLTGRAQFSREDVIILLRQQGRALCNKVMTFLTEAQRCKPLPRHALVTMVIPFFEGVALTFPSTESKSHARGLHEQVLALYGFSTNLSNYASVLFDGSKISEGAVPKAGQLRSSELAKKLNAEDWANYVFFERFVAKDLQRSQKVMERARRLCVAPQLLLASNHTPIECGQ